MIVPKGYKTVYQTAEVWKNFKSIIEEDDERLKCQLTVHWNEGGQVIIKGTEIRNTEIAQKCKKGEKITLQINPEAGYKIQSVIVNGTDITNQIVNNTYSFIVTTNTSFIIHFEYENSTANETINQNKVSVYGFDGIIHITKSQQGELIDIYTINGWLVRHLIATGNELHIKVPQRRIYIVKVGESIFKLNL